MLTSIPIQMRKESNLVGVHILCEGDELEIYVEPDIELEELVDCVRILGVSELSQLEQLDGESGQWTVVTETADLRVQSGAKYRPLLHEVQELVDKFHFLQTFRVP